MKNVILVAALIVLGAASFAQTTTVKVVNSVNRGWFSPVGPFAGDIPIYRFQATVLRTNGKNTVFGYLNQNTRLQKNLRQWATWYGAGYIRDIGNGNSLSVMAYLVDNTQPLGTWSMGIVKFQHKFSDSLKISISGIWNQGLWGASPGQAPVLKVESEWKQAIGATGFGFNLSPEVTVFRFLDPGLNLDGFYFGGTFKLSHVCLFGWGLFAQANLPIRSSGGWFTKNAKFIWNVGIKHTFQIKK